MLEVEGLEGLRVDLGPVSRVHQMVALGLFWAVTGLPVMGPATGPPFRPARVLPETSQEPTLRTKLSLA